MLEQPFPRELVGLEQAIAQGLSPSLLLEHRGTQETGPAQYYSVVPSRPGRRQRPLNPSHELDILLYESASNHPELLDLALPKHGVELRFYAHDSRSDSKLAAQELTYAFLERVFHDGSIAEMTYGSTTRRYFVLALPPETFTRPVFHKTAQHILGAIKGYFFEEQYRFEPEAVSGQK